MLGPQQEQIQAQPKEEPLVDPNGIHPILMELAHTLKQNRNKIERNQSYGNEKDREGGAWRELKSGGKGQNNAQLVDATIETCLLAQAMLQDSPDNILVAFKSEFVAELHSLIDIIPVHNVYCAHVDILKNIAKETPKFCQKLYQLGVVLSLARMLDSKDETLIICSLATIRYIVYAARDKESEKKGGVHAYKQKMEKDGILAAIEQKGMNEALKNEEIKGNAACILGIVCGKNSRNLTQTISQLKLTAINKLLDDPDLPQIAVELLYVIT
ncbi:MAG: hypothetical protein EZS28_004045 [Streblomastix strix]|uniref:Uncharacterized protein n=1 Tax=Streblomastix strix TaxID=222440 RepID=A0A5J4WZV5_9EUKA|nr:MAG: hypothetical protein EZS28_004045 [Streblomastix strix]